MSSIRTDGKNSGPNYDNNMDTEQKKYLEWKKRTL